MSENQRKSEDRLPVTEALGRLGLSHAALTALMTVELEQAGIGLVAGPVASAVAHAIESNNAEILRQLTSSLRDLERFRPAPPREDE